MAPYGQGAFDDHFRDVAGQNIHVDEVFEIPFDCILTRASAFTNNSTAVDAYITIFRGDGVAPENHIVDATALPVFTNQLNHVVLANLPMFKGDKITVRLNLLSNNDVTKAKWVLAFASKVFPIAA